RELHSKSLLPHPPLKPLPEGEGAKTCCATHACGRSAAAFFPAIYPWAVQRPSPCWLKPPADSPPQYRPGITCPCMSTTWHCALILSPARVSCTSGVAQAA